MNDKSEAMSWLKKAEDDLLHARLSMDGKSYDWATLASQQVAEKSLKALFLFKGNELIKTHDLTFFGRKLNASREILVHCGLLNPFYTTSRYPDILPRDIQMN